MSSSETNDTQIESPAVVEPVDSDTTVTQHPSNSAKPRSYFAIALALAAISISLFTLVTGYQKEQLLNQQDTEIQTKVEELEQYRNTFSNRHAEIQNRLSALAKDTEAYQQTLTKLEETVYQTAAKTTRNQRDWILAEATYLLQIAYYRLQWLRDIPSAVAALKSVDRSLASLNDPTLLQFRQHLIEDISTLQSTPPLDSGGTALKLLVLANTVDKLPPVPTANIQHDFNSTLGSKLAHWFGLSRIDRTDHQVNNQTTPAQQLHLVLSAARYAVLRLDSTDYALQIDAAVDLIDQYYKPEHTEVRRFKDALTTTLQVKTVFPNLPDIANAVSELNKIKYQYREHVIEPAIPPSIDQAESL